MEIEIKGVHKAFAGTTALQPTDLSLAQGEFTTLLGPSGCGKTTLLRMISGLEQPDGGEIYSAGTCIYSASQRIDVPAHKRKFGMVFQDFALWPHMTVFENVAFGLKAAKLQHNLKEKVTEALAMVRLQGMENRYPHQLSGGQQQRVAFARAVAIRPALVLFDEPLSALDAVLREEMRVEMMSLVKDMGLTALYVTHDQIEAMSMSDNIVVMRKGEVLQRGTPESIYKSPSHPFVASFIGKSNWIEPDKAMFRPEQARWHRTSDHDLNYMATIRHVSYVGERYELRLQVNELLEWTVYSHHRMPVGEQVTLYVSPESVCWVQGRSTAENVDQRLQQLSNELIALG